VRLVNSGAIQFLGQRHSQVGIIEFAQVPGTCRIVDTDLARFHGERCLSQASAFNEDLVCDVVSHFQRLRQRNATRDRGTYAVEYAQPPPKDCVALARIASDDSWRP
jgi:hypothetical protein